MRQRNHSRKNPFYRRNLRFVTAFLSLAIAALANQAPTVFAQDRQALALQFPHIFVFQGPSIKKVALTFDDGPDDLYTPQILSILKREHVHATFFVLGIHVQKYPHVILRIKNEGHAIGNHSYDHDNLQKASSWHILWEVERTERLLKKTVRVTTRLFRAPYGNVNNAMLRQLGKRGYQVVNWSVDSQDWRSLSAKQVLQNTLPAVNPGSIILMHCAGNPKEILTGTVQALPELIHTLRSRGYAFVTIPELFSPHTATVHAKW
ncbi:polysaccharide deacetylase family protein [Ferroacidibacillus organovorans]|uniref:polysaccharide deacetylase family protein n=1 Tax=Ferroacidibacillus organovorans TaxID=1765683 RepID=UPI000830F3AD|nr:polysaccharide deacetylase family protein [Ferroacidibacillus organovorans]